MHSLANLYAAEGRIEESEDLYLKSIEILKSRLGINHPDVESIIEEYDRFKTKEEEPTKTAHGTVEYFSSYLLGWGALLAVGLLSTAVLALKQLKK